MAPTLNSKSDMKKIILQKSYFAFISAAKGLLNLKEVLEAENQKDQVDGLGKPFSVEHKIMLTIFYD
jgi:hypothetical protein